VDDIGQVLNQLQEQTAMVEMFQERYNTEHQRAIQSEFQIKLLNKRIESMTAEIESLRTPSEGVND